MRLRRLCRCELGLAFGGWASFVNPAFKLFLLATENKFWKRWFPTCIKLVNPQASSRFMSGRNSLDNPTAWWSTRE